MSIIKVVGIDPALRNLGICRATINLNTLDIDVVDLVLVETEANKKNAKVVRKNCDDLDRAKTLHDALVEHCKGHHLAFCEVPVGSQSARAMASYGICIGVLAACSDPDDSTHPKRSQIGRYREQARCEAGNDRVGFREVPEGTVVGPFVVVVC